MKRNTYITIGSIVIVLLVVWLGTYLYKSYVTTPSELGQAKAIGSIGPGTGTASCYDSDGSSTNPYLQTGFVADNSRGKNAIYDKCADAQVLIEQYCSPTGKASENYTCPEGCKTPGTVGSRCRSGSKDY